MSAAWPSSRRRPLDRQDTTCIPLLLWGGTFEKVWADSAIPAAGAREYTPSIT